MSRHDIQIVDESAFWYWINERHAIWVRRAGGQPKPWTDDGPMRQFKFTNVFRELDKGTLALRTMEEARRLSFLDGDTRPQAGLIFNTIWYRMFNRYEHATDIGWITDYDDLRIKIMAMAREGELLFTSAHMTVGREGEPKHITMLSSLSGIWEDLDPLTTDIISGQTLQYAFKRLRQYYGIGPFIAYEMVSDLRHHVLADAPDIMSWANIGPGCKRGLARIGLGPDLVNLHHLLRSAIDHVDEHLLPHVRHECRPYFELREIEHSLCEFDKHQRVLTGAGRPRERYEGV